MPLVAKAEGYPVSEAKAATAEVQPSAAPAVTHQGVTHSQKDRSIVRQVAWKVAGFAMGAFTGSPDAWFEKCLEIRAKIEKDILEA